MRFLDRADAGQQLASLLEPYRAEEPLILGLPRGGVPVAREVANSLEAPMDIWVVRKVGAPDFPELGLGAVAQGGITYLNRETIELVGASDEEVQRIVREKQREVEERAARLRKGRPPPDVKGRTIILVDDGIATGGTVRAAIESLRAAEAGKIVLAVPVAATQSLAELRPLVDDVVCVHATPALYAIGAWYDDFHQVSDAEVIRLLEVAPSVDPLKPVGATAAPASAPASGTREVTIPVGAVQLNGTLSGPARPRGLVLFAHGSGSSRFSPRNRHVASILHRHGLATLLFDLLTADEEVLDAQTAELRFDIDLLASRLVAATDWARRFPETRDLPIGYFGSSTGAAAALVAAAERPSAVSAIVSRGGRPDLAWDHLDRVRAPTLLIVGGEDHAVIELNRRAYSRLAELRRLIVIPGATHLFEEPGALDKVAHLAGDWLGQHLERAALSLPGAAP